MSLTNPHVNPHVNKTMSSITATRSQVNFDNHICNDSIIKQLRKN